MDDTYEKVVLSDANGGFTIFDYQGKELTSICVHSVIEEKDVVKQKFLDKDLFMLGVEGRFIGVSDLNKRYSETPYGMLLEAWDSKLHIDEYLTYARCEEFFVLFGRSSENYRSMNGRNAILVGIKNSKRDKFMVVDEFYDLMNSFTGHSLAVTETELIISVDTEVIVKGIEHVVSQDTGKISYTPAVVRSITREYRVPRYTTLKN